MLGLGSEEGRLAKFQTTPLVWGRRLAASPAFPHVLLTALGIWGILASLLAARGCVAT